ncbi:M23 family metallopeptidase [Streptomyces sp. DH18]|uniref:M23 family metallopeptidase n=1 Tax=Streptomyces sp. DH18 TaxID=3040126 RepID=UPI0024420388|nr:M23 family metallopeptidase [Streptomyces sp. DH18]MDG9685858.1 M23 family metallopeptidase [Streptomyces sp. DH18]
MKRATNQHTIRPSAFRVRGAVLAAGLGASVVLGAGSAFASSGSEAAAAPLAAATAADSVAQQATAQGKAAAKKASDAKKKAEDKKEAAKKNAASWKAPVKKYTLSASYGTGGARWASKHSGQDFAVPVGTSVVAAHKGTVVKAGPNGAGDGPAYGNAVVIKHSNGKYSQYAHLSKVNVKIGQTVKTGQKIALSGNTGNSSGPHLHFEIRTTPNYGSALNPAAFLRSVHVSI